MVGTGSMWEPSLPAIAVSLSTEVLNVSQSSRASPAPTGTVFIQASATGFAVSLTVTES